MVSIVAHKRKEDESKSINVVKHTSSSYVLAPSDVTVLKTKTTEDVTKAADIDKNRKEEESNTTDTECSTRICTKNSIESEDDSISVLTFPIQLMGLIEKETVDDNAAAINGQKALEWLPTGDKFIIRDRLTVERCVLPKYFNNKCKFMSFVRKLYRWGFRQVEKDNSDAMIFFHANFSRGDKKKCLTMRSIVKKPSAVTIMGLSNSSSNRSQSYGRVGAFPNAGDIMAEHLLQSNRQAIYHSDSSMTLSGMGYGESAFNMQIGTNPGLPMTYGLVMQKQMPQSNSLNSGFDFMNQRPRYNMMGLAMNSSEVQGSLASSAAFHANQDYNAAASQPSAAMNMSSTLPPSAKEEIIMASRILKEHPTLDNWQALQLAKRRLNGASASITRQCLWLS